MPTETETIVSDQTITELMQVLRGLLDLGPRPERRAWTRRADLAEAVYLKVAQNQRGHS
jgi:hypothetical protein